jgi:hypothetical protein
VDDPLQHRRVEVGLLDDPGRARAHGLPGVVHLLAVLVPRIGHEDRGPAQRRALGHGRGAGAAQDEVGDGVRPPDVRQEVDHGRRDVQALVAGAHVRRVPVAAAVQHLERTGGTRLQPLEHPRVEAGRPLAAAEDEQGGERGLEAELLLGRVRAQVVSQRRPRDPAAPPARQRRLGRCGAEADARREVRQQTRRPARHGVALDQVERQPQAARRQRAGHGGIATEADDGCGAQLAQEPPRPLHRQGKARGKEPRGAVDARSGELDDAELAADAAAVAAVRRHEKDRLERGQRARHGEPGKEVAAGAAPGEDDDLASQRCDQVFASK